VTNFRNYFGLGDDDLIQSGSASPQTIKAVIGQWADYRIEWDGMVESGPGCMERMQARIDALPEGHPSKVQLIPKESD